MWTYLCTMEINMVLCEIHQMIEYTNHPNWTKGTGVWSVHYFTVNIAHYDMEHPALRWVIS